MIRILFVCHGNICRSPMSEFILKDMVKARGLENEFYIESAATTSEEIWNGVGNPIYPPARKCLQGHGIWYDPEKRARLLTRADYDKFDYIIGMDAEDRWDMQRIFGEGEQKDAKDSHTNAKNSQKTMSGSANKVSLLLDFTDHPRDVADPWYTRNFEVTYKDVVEGCEAFLASLNF